MKSKLKRKQDKQDWKGFKQWSKLPKKILINDNIKVKPQYVINTLKFLKENQEYIDKNSKENQKSRVSFSVTPRTYELMESLVKNGLIAPKIIGYAPFEKRKWPQVIIKFLEQQKGDNPDIIQEITVKLNIKITEKGERYIEKFKTRLKRWHIITVFIISLLMLICAIISVVYQGS